MRASSYAATFVLAFLVMLLAACSAAPEVRIAPRAEALLLVGGQIVDPARAGGPRRGDILIVDGRIAAVGDRLRVPSGTRRLDVSGKYLVPGLWDMHAHVAADGPVGGALEDYLGHGIVGIRDMGGRAEELLALRSAVASGDRLGPTMVVAGPTVNGEAAAEFHLPVRDRAEAAAAVARLAANGVDFIKIHRQVSREAFAGLRDEAKQRGLPLAGHVPLAMSWIEGADAGMQSIEHIQTLAENELVKGPDPVKATFATFDRLDGPRGDEIFKALARNGTRWTPTLIYYERSWRTDSPQRRALKQQALVRMKPLVARAVAAGVTLLAGTDEAAAARGPALLDELARLVAAGLSPRQALAAATVNAHRVAGRGPGPIRAGGEATFLVLDADPLLDIANVRRLHALLLRGRVIDGAGLTRLRVSGASTT